jgi:hypothetical protein
MSKLPKAIIKKYGITRKAWAVFKGKKTSVAKTPMAKRRSKSRSKARSFSFSRKKSRRSSRGSGGGSVNMTGLLIGAAVYGAGREFASDKLSVISNKLPFGELADEVTLGTLGYFMAKGKIPMINRIPYSKDIGKAALTIEAARIGAYVGQKYLPTSTATNSSSGIVYL